MELTHMGLDVLTEDLNAISETTVMLRYPDGLSKNPRFVWEQPRVLKYADLLQT
jgi:hypothetical protein